jgi:hypothetical protein
MTARHFALMLTACVLAFSTPALAAGWKFLVEFPPGMREGCAKPPCYHGLFTGGETVTKKQCEAARPYFNKQGFKAGPCVPFDQRQPGEIIE